MADADPQVVWRRSFDEHARGRRRRKLLLWYGLPGAVVLAVGFALGGTGPFLGLLILLGLFGLLLFAWMELLSHNERMNPEVRIEGDTLVVGRRRVNIDHAEAWSTAMATQTTSVGAPSHSTSRFQLAKVLIRVPVMRDGVRATRPDGGQAFDVVGFAWPAMNADELEELRVALAPHLDAPWVPLEKLRET